VLVTLERECTLNLLIINILVYLKEIEILLGLFLLGILDYLHLSELAFKLPDLFGVRHHLLSFKLVWRDNIGGLGSERGMSEASLDHFVCRLHLEDPAFHVCGRSLKECDGLLGILNHGFKILFSRALACAGAIMLAV
jgi:hypothetical protein